MSEKQVNTVHVVGGLSPDDQRGLPLSHLPVRMVITPAVLARDDLNCTVCHRLCRI